MSNKKSSDRASSIASKVLRTGVASKKDALTLAGSVLSQDPNKGPRK